MDKQAGEISCKVPDADKLAMYSEPFDMGAKVMAGYEMPEGLQVILNASLGIADIESSFNG